MMSVPSTSRCLVTGASDPTSIGYACAVALLKAGAASVTIMGRDKAKVDAAVASLKGGKVYGIVGDLKKPETMASLVDEAAGLMGGHIDILVVAGGNGGSEYLGLDLHDPAAYRMSQDVAVISPMLLTHAAVAKKDKEQAIVMVSTELISFFVHVISLIVLKTCMHLHCSPICSSLSLSLSLSFSPLKGELAGISDPVA